MKINKILILISFFLTSIVFSQKSASIFSNTEDLLNRVKNQNAQLFAPENFAKGMKLYNRAKSLYEQGVASDSVFAILQDAESYFYKASERAKINKDLFSEVLELRKKAQTSVKNTPAALPFFNEAEKSLKQGIILSEREESLDEINKRIDKAKKNYLAAITINKHQNIFTPVIEIRQAAIKEKADLFSPKNFNEAESHFNQAINYAQNSDFENFVKEITESKKLFKQAYSISVLISSNNNDLLTAIKYAEKAGAENFATEKWDEAKDKLAEASEDFEEENYKDYKKEITLAKKLFWDAEEAALYNRYVGQYEKTLDSLKELDVGKFAPMQTRKAELLISKAKATFNDDKYDKNLPNYSAKINGELTKTKEIIKLYETGNQALIDSLILNEIYPFGEKNAPEKKIAVVEEPSKPEIKVEEKTVKKPKPVAVTKGFEKKETTIEQKQQKQKVKQEPSTPKQLSPIDKTIQYFKKTFSENEAILVRKRNNSFRIRLVGLKLKAYQKKLTTQQRKLLMKLRNVIQYSRDLKKAIIEVYSDSKGGDDLNKRLSESRAAIVKSTLIKYGVRKNKLVAKGIGNKNPIASNATFEGRNKNRRIEVIFVF